MHSVTKQRSDRAINLYFCLLQGSIFCMVAIHNAFFALLLADRGFTESMIGQVATVTGAASLVLQPLLGMICDRWRINRLLFILGGIIAPISYWSISQTADFLLCLFWASCFIGLSTGTQALTAGWVASLNNFGYKIDFGFSRGIGSLSFALGSIFFGLVVDWFGLGALPVLLACCGVGVAIAAILLPRPEKQTVVHSQNRDLGRALAQLTKNRAYILLVICSFFSSVPAMAFTTFFPVFFMQEGGSGLLLGIAHFVLAIVEVPVMLWYRKIERRFGAELLLAVAMLGYGLKNLVLSFSVGLPMIIAALTLQAIGLALMIPATQSMVAARTDPACAATAQTLATSVSQGLGGIAAGLFCSWLVSFCSLRIVFAITSLFAIGAAVLFALTVWLPERKKIS